MLLLFSSPIEKFHINNLSYFHKNHFLLAQNIANSSTAGFKAKKLEQPIDYKSFTHHLQNIQKIPDAKISYINGQVKPNGNDVNEKEQYREMLSNENSIDLEQSILQEFAKLNAIAAGIHN